jgi:hypothetical protein
VVLRSKSCGDSNRCTLCRGKIRSTRQIFLTLGPCMVLDHTYLTYFASSDLSLVINSVGQSHYSWETGVLITSPARRLIDPWVPTRFPSHSQSYKQWRKPDIHRRQDTRLIRSINQHAINTFNTCSCGPIHLSLTDTDGGYSVGGASFQHHTPLPSQPTVPRFSHKDPVWSPDYKILPKKIQSSRLKNLWPSHGLPTTRPYTLAYIDA